MEFNYNKRIITLITIHMATIENNHTKPLETTLNEHELSHFKELLLQKRAMAKSELDLLEKNVENLTESDDADYSSLTHHLGDVGSDVEEENLNYQLIERTRKYIKEIDGALDRIQNKTYGICQATGKPISIGRLEAVPHTRFSIDAKKKGLIKDI